MRAWRARVRVRLRGMAWSTSIDPAQSGSKAGQSLARLGPAPSRLRPRSRRMRWDAQATYIRPMTVTTLSRPRLSRAVSFCRPACACHFNQNVGRRAAARGLHPATVFRTPPCMSGPGQHKYLATALPLVFYALPVSSPSIRPKPLGLLTRVPLLLLIFAREPTFDI